MARTANISPFATIRGLEHLSIGERSSIGRGTLVIAISRHQGSTYSATVTIGSDVYVGRRCTIATTGSLIIGDETTLGDNVYLGAAQHSYENPLKSVLMQPLIEGSIKIGRGVWIGYGAFVTANGTIDIGEHAVIGANSVVTKSVPPFTVVAGAPARPIKRYDVTQQRWVRI